MGRERKRTERQRNRERERHKVKEKKQPRVVSTFLASTLLEVYMSKKRIAKGKPEQNLYAKPIENGWVGSLEKNTFTLRDYHTLKNHFLSLFKLFFDSPLKKYS